MTDTVISQNIYPSSWITVCTKLKGGFVCVFVFVAVISHRKMRYELEILAVVFGWLWDVMKINPQKWGWAMGKGLSDGCWHAWCEWLTLNCHGYHCYCVFCELCTRVHEIGCHGYHMSSLWGIHWGRRSTSIKHVTQCIRMSNGHFIQCVLSVRYKLRLKEQLSIEPIIQSMFRWAPSM